MPAMREDVRRAVEEYMPRIQAIGSGGFVQPSVIPTRVAAGQFVTVNSGASSTTTLALGTFVPQAIPLDENLAIDQTVIEVTTLGAGNTYRIGFYADSGLCTPGVLILDAGTVATDTTGFKTASTVLTLPAGLVWVVAVPQGGAAATVRTMLDPLVAVPLSAVTANAFAAASGVTGALPSTAPALATSSGAAPRILLRKA